MIVRALTVRPKLSEDIKKACSSDINIVPIEQNNNAGDGALFNYSDEFIVSASV